MSKQSFDFTEVKEFELKTPAGETVLREPSPSEYFEYLEEISVEGRKLSETYEIYIKYFMILGGEEKILRTLTLDQIMQIVKGMSGVEKK